MSTTIFKCNECKQGCCEAKVETSNVGNVDAPIVCLYKLPRHMPAWVKRLSDAERAEKYDEIVKLKDKKHCLSNQICNLNERISAIKKELKS